MMTAYSSSFRDRMVRRLAGPGAVSASALAREVGVSQGTLSRWLRDARTIRGMRDSTKGPEGRGDRKRWTAREKLRVVMETGVLSDTDLGAYLRREGVHGAQVQQWRAAAEAALGPPARGARRTETTKLRALERELRRKEAALAEAAALLVLKKKAHAIWGDADDSMDRRNAP